MNKLENMITSDLRAKIHPEDVSIAIRLTATDCQGRWPRACIMFGQDLVFDGEVNTEKLIEFNKQDLSEDSYTLSIRIYGKTNKDTVVDSAGDIVENMSLHIDQFVLNGVDIVKNKFIYEGHYVMDLSDEKRTYFKSQDLNSELRDYHFYENGLWKISVDMPVVKNIILKKRRLETFETIPYHDTMLEIASKLKL